MVLGPGAGDVHAAQVEMVPGAANGDRGFVLVPRVVLLGLCAPRSPAHRGLCDLVHWGLIPGPHSDGCWEKTLL